MPWNRLACVRLRGSGWYDRLLNRGRAQGMNSRSRAHRAAWAATGFAACLRCPRKDVAPYAPFAMTIRSGNLHMTLFAYFLMEPIHVHSVSFREKVIFSRRYADSRRAVDDENACAWARCSGIAGCSEAFAEKSSPAGKAAHYGMKGRP